MLSTARTDTTTTHTPHGLSHGPCSQPHGPTQPPPTHHTDPVTGHAIFSPLLSPSAPMGGLSLSLYVMCITRQTTKMTRGGRGRKSGTDEPPLRQTMRRGFDNRTAPRNGAGRRDPPSSVGPFPEIHPRVRQRLHCHVPGSIPPLDTWQTCLQEQTPPRAKGRGVLATGILALDCAECARVSNAFPFGRPRCWSGARRCGSRTRTRGGGARWSGGGWMRRTPSPRCCAWKGTSSHACSSCTLLSQDLPLKLTCSPMTPKSTQTDIAA
jgi:hypothetical protein